MPAYRRGSMGPEVERLQTRLKSLGHYLGPLDGDFGGGTESAVKVFQKNNGLTVDGVVGPETWKRLFGDDIPAPALLSKPLALRSLALTGAFETSTAPPHCFAGLSGDFDGQGISFGVLQWNLGQGSLQPLLLKMNQLHPRVLEEIFDEHCAELRAMLAESRQEQLNWARSVQDRKFKLVEPWRGLFKTLGRREEFHNIQVEAATELHQAARRLCETFTVWSERALALMFDIKVQNGDIKPIAKARIEQDYKRLAEAGAPEEEVARLQSIATHVAESSNPRWVEDVRARKLTLANGGGIVHGKHYDLDGEYGIGLRAFALE